jgi:hypothetical protein
MFSNLINKMENLEGLKAASFQDFVLRILSRPPMDSLTVCNGFPNQSQRYVFRMTAYFSDLRRYRTYSKIKKLNDWFSGQLQISLKILKTSFKPSGGGAFR